MLGQVNHRTSWRIVQGFTLVEALVTVAILAALMALVVPSAINWIVIQRVKGSASELVTDIRFAKGEAIKRNQPVTIRFTNLAGNLSCYSVHTAYNDALQCDCAKGVGLACNQSRRAGRTSFDDGLVELKTVTVSASSNVVISANRQESFLAPNGFPDPTLAGVFTVDVDGSDHRILRVISNAAGRPMVCAPSGSKMVGYPACPG